MKNPSPKQPISNSETVEEKAVEKARANVHEAKSLLKRARKELKKAKALAKEQRKATKAGKGKTSKREKTAAAKPKTKKAATAPKKKA